MRRGTLRSAPLVHTWPARRPMTSRTTMDTKAGGDAEKRIERAGAIVARVAQNVATVVEGKDEQIRLVLAALACKGHVLLEDVPGTAKTVLARALAGSIEGATVSRIQCTPDLQPTDITGLSVWNPQHAASSSSGRARSSPTSSSSTRSTARCRRRSRRCSRGWPSTRSRSTASRHPLPDPFFVIATENTIEQEGTFPLPEAQLDRFLIRTSLGYPSLDEELDDRRRAAARPSARAPAAGRRRSTSSRRVRARSRRSTSTRC